MIPVLYGPTEKRFTSRGLGPLPDASMAHIEEVRLGEYELEMEYPVTGLHFDELQYGNVIKARNAYLGEQPFDIYYISKPMSGIVTVRARHISYRLNKKVLTPCSSSSAAGSMSAIETHILDGSDFTFWTDKSTQANWAVTEPKNVRAALGGTEGSILDVFGGEYEWDGFTVKLHGNRGADNGVSIRFGKNLLDLVAELDASDVVTACVPYYTASDGTCVYGSKVKSSAWSSVNDLVTVMDMKEYFTAPEGAADNWTPTTAAMEETALSLMEQRLVYQATQHLKVDFALLSQSKEYAHLAALERVNLCDYVTVAHPGMGIDVKVKVIKTVWDVLADRYDSIELGEPTARLSETLFKDLNDALNGIQTALDEKVSRTHMDIAIENATNLLTGGTGGHVVIGRNADGEPNEIFIMNTADQSTATSVIRINMNGIGFSSTGINGPFTNAWTIDGHFVADFIDTGTLTGSIIKAGILLDEAGVNYWNMETGEFQLTPAAKIKTGTDSYAVLSQYIGGIADEYVTELEGDLQTQIDSKIDTWYQSADPSTSWTAAEKTAHTGDLWYKTTDNTTWRWSGSAWQEQEVPDAVFDEIDGKSAIFYGTTSQTYTGVQTGDYLVDSTSGKTYRWNGSSWVVQTDYASAISNYDTSLNQQAVFNKLTNNSQNEGVYLSNGHLYVNGSMIRAGEIDAGMIKAGILQSQDSNPNFFLNMLTGAISMKDATLTGGSLTTENGLYKTIIENGFLRHYHNGDYFGKVGSSIFTQNKKGMMFDIGYDADYGGFAVQESANADASLAFWYDRVGDQFISAKNIYMQANDLTVASIIGNQQLNLEASQFNFNKKSGTTGNVIAEGDIYMNTSDKVATESYVNTQLNNHIADMNSNVLPQYATQSWVTNQGYLTNAGLSNYATMDWVDDNYVTLTEFQQTAAVAKTLRALTDYSSDPSYTVGDLNHLKWSGRTGYNTTGNGVTTNLHWIAPRRFKYENSVQVPDWSGGYLSYYVDVKNGIITRFIEKISTDSTYEYELPGS